MLSIKELVENILKIESSEKVFDFQINNIYIWKLIRFKLFLEISYKKGLSSSERTLIKKDYRLFFKNLIENTKKCRVKSENLFFISNRFQKIDKKFKEIYSYEIIEKNKKNSEIVYMPLTRMELKEQEIRYSSIENIDYVMFEIFKISKIINISKDDLKKIRSVKEKLENNFKIENIDILEEKSLKKILKKFETEYNYYKKFLKKREPKRIYIICSYGKEALIAAAQNLEIEVIEIQHGMMNKYHVGYHFPNNNKIPYFPDKIMLFGEYWRKNTSIPLIKEKLEVVGYPYMAYQINKYNEIIENERQVLFISQGTIGKQLTEKAIEFAKKNPNLKVVVRLHPGEFSIWKKEYKILFENRDLLNIKISDDNEKNLYEYLCESKYIIGVFSTTIYEALYMEKKVGILNLPGIEYVEDLIENKLVEVFDISNLIDIKKFDNILKLDGEYYFSNKKYKRRIPK